MLYAWIEKHMRVVGSALHVDERLIIAQDLQHSCKLVMTPRNPDCSLASLWMSAHDEAAIINSVPLARSALAWPVGKDLTIYSLTRFLPPHLAFQDMKHKLGQWSIPSRLQPIIQKFWIMLSGSSRTPWEASQPRRWMFIVMGFPNCCHYCLSINVTS